jgi:DNA-binding protein HU-beta
MTREELIAQIASDAGTTKVQAKAALESFMDAVTKTLKKGGRLSLVGFGTFSTSKRSARTGRNPKTGEALQIKARKVAKFKAGSALAKAVNGNK